MRFGLIATLNLIVHWPLTKQLYSPIQACAEEHFVLVHGFLWVFYCIYTVYIENRHLFLCNLNTMLAITIHLSGS